MWRNKLNINSDLLNQKEKKDLANLQDNVNFLISINEESEKPLPVFVYELLKKLIEIHQKAYKNFQGLRFWKIDFAQCLNKHPHKYLLARHVFEILNEIVKDPALNQIIEAEIGLSVTLALQQKSGDKFTLSTHHDKNEDTIALKN